MRKLIFHDYAKLELKRIRKYTVKNWGTNQAGKYLSELRHTLQLIKSNPLLGVEKPDICGGAYSFVYKSHVIYYQFDKEKVVIAGVLHQSMIPKKHLKGRIA
ncbi:MAG: type II toxin-antitoxin system RelE/ParE family toxin [Proteobacteria bacterium]|nr:type II toxin-antitoxin system RelE/ParE family toxin [Pseudomonadota bacterium]